MERWNSRNDVGRHEEEEEEDRRAASSSRGVFLSLSLAVLFRKPTTGKINNKTRDEEGEWESVGRRKCNQSAHVN